MINKKALISMIDELVKKYGRKAVNNDIITPFTGIGFYREDGRKSGVQFAKDCIISAYNDEVPIDGYVELEDTYSQTTNRELYDAVLATEWRLKLSY